MCYNDLENRRCSIMNVPDIRAKRINEAIKASGLSYAELEKMTGFSKSSIQRYATGETKKIPVDFIEKLANITNTDVRYLMGWEDEQPNALPLVESKIYQVPVFSSVSAGFGAYACSDIIDYMPLFIENSADVPDMFCIKVTGQSMFPKIEDGDIIVVRKQDSVDSGSIAVVLVDGEEGFVKRVVYDNETIELQSINPEYAPKIFKGAEVLRVRVVGIVKQVIKTL
jgi:repressor LexA